MSVGVLVRAFSTALVVGGAFAVPAAGAWAWSGAVTETDRSGPSPVKVYVYERTPVRTAVARGYFDPAQPAKIFGVCDLWRQDGTPSVGEIRWRDVSGKLIRSTLTAPNPSAGQREACRHRRLTIRAGVPVTVTVCVRNGSVCASEKGFS